MCSYKRLWPPWKFKTPHNFTEALKSVYEGSVARGDRIAESSPYWWSEEIMTLRQDCTRVRRMFLRSARDAEAERQAKLNCGNLSEPPNEKQLGPSLPFALEEDFKGKTLRERFPKRVENRPLTGITEVEIPFTRLELLEAAGKLRASTAQDITPEVLKQFCVLGADTALNLYNTLLAAQSFSVEWKDARVVLPLKSGKPVDSSGAYRPTCLLNVMGKLYEQLIKARLLEELEDRGPFARRQFGFRNGYSTIHALRELSQTVDECRDRFAMLITLDVRNAFNTASWGRIITKLRAINICPYLMGDMH
ncbi:hypothetical protein NQ315_003269 [Exocentrus adspersus]|uniref:Reverse transcriptase domain-containing protein n=1 Tax=Exocentrus adspersus TaxID=1586481 RepID=A0AAV8VCR4_9CUCU|nr:hypothetical protein NQ315_003269 [Exocentrus adspersus]